MTVAEFVEQWLGDPMQEHGNASSHSAMSKMSLYLKDWHFVKVLVRTHSLLIGSYNYGQLRS